MHEPTPLPSSGNSEDVLLLAASLTKPKVDITWKVRKRSKQLPISKAEVTLELKEINKFTTAVQSVANESAELEECYSCKHCNFCSSDKKRFEDHISSRRSSHFQCELCTFKSCTSIGMNTHIEEVHSSLFKIVPKIQPLQTTVVRKASQAKATLASSQISDFSGPPAKSRHQCLYCKKRFWNQAVFDFHIRTHTQKPSFKCNGCSLVFNSQAKQKKHISARRIQKCLHCDMTFCFPRTLTEHVKATHAATYSDEPVMPVLFKYGEDSESMVENPPAEEPMETLICGNIPAKMLPTIYCSQCGLTFSNDQLLLQHNNDSHQDLSPSNFSGESTSPEETVQEKCQEKRIRFVKEIQLFRLETEQEGVLGSGSQKGKLSCHFCNKDFKTRLHLEHHYTIHTAGKGLFKCNLCSYVTNSSSQLQRHQEFSKSRNGNSFFCNECDFNSCSSNYFRIHLSEKHPEEEACALGEQPQEIWSHKSMHKVSEEYLGNPGVAKQIIYSEESIPSLEHLEKAKSALLIMTTNSVSKWSQPNLQPDIEKTQEVCRYCTKVFEGSHRKMDLEEHIRSHSDDKSFKCNQCSYTSAQLSALHAHKRHHHLKSKQIQDVHSFSVPLGGSHSRNENMEGRNVERNSENTYKCTSCDNRSESCNHCSFTSDSSVVLQKDVQDAQSTNVPPEDTYPRNGKMKETNVDRKPEKPYKCTYCEYRSKYRTAIRAHERIHTFEKPYQCNTCGKQYSYRSSLSKHKRKKHLRNATTGLNGKSYQVRKIHFLDPITLNRENTQGSSGEGPSNYSVKDKVFTTKPKLSVPSKSLLKCKLCSYKSKYIGNIVSHSRIHNVEKPFKCQYCPYRSAWEHDWKKHEVRHVARGAAREIHETSPHNQTQLPQMGSPVLPKLPDQQSMENKKPFKSRLCDNRSDRRGHVEKHERTHTTGKKQFECRPFQFNPLQKALEEDPPESEEIQGKYICSFCNQIFKDGGTLEVHLRSHTDGFQCDRCSYTSSTKSRIKRHMESNGRKEGQLYNCPKCTFKSCTTHYFRNHFTETHLEEDTSSVLEHLDEANCTPPLLTPIQTRMEEDKLSQEHLDQSKPPLLKSTEEIPRPLVTRPQIKKTWVVCNFCSKRFGGPSKNRQLEEHIRVHTGEKPFKCSQCSYVCAQHSALSHHRRRFHPITTSSIQDKWKKSNRSALHVHRRRNHLTASSSISPKSNESISKSSNYSGLTSCSSVVLEKHDLGDHSATVPPEDSYPGKGNMDDRNVQGKPEKPYKCTYCNFRSKYRSNTRIHERIHTGEKPYQCNTCGKQFAYGSNFSKHKRRHLRNQIQFTPKVGVNMNTLLGGKFNFKDRIIRKPVNTQGNSGEGTRKAVEGKVFTTNPKLSVHPKMYNCKFCPRKAKQKSSIVAHTRIHTGEKPFKCDYCPYRSAWEHDWKKHEVRHVARGDKRESQQTRPEPHLTQIGSPMPQNIGQLRIENTKLSKSRFCNYRSDRSGHTKKHGRGETQLRTIEEKCFECKTCGAMFTCRRSLFIHRKNHYI